jgi:hypothetical protein
MYFVQYEIRPLPQSDDFESAGGAIANCFVRTASKKQAKELALKHFQEISWEVLSLEDGPFVTTRDVYLEAEPGWLVAFDEAAAEGECYVLHMWPNEAQEDDALH